MKYLVFILALATTGLAAASTSNSTDASPQTTRQTTSQTTRLMDGQNAVCAEGADVGSLAQAITLTSSQENKSSSTLNLKLEFFQCVKESGNFVFKSSALSNSPFKVKNPEFLVTTEDSKILVSQKLDMNLATQDITVVVPRNSVEGLDLFVRILADRGGFDYESFGPFRITE